MWCIAVGSVWAMWYALVSSVWSIRRQCGQCVGSVVWVMWCVMCGACGEYGVSLCHVTAGQHVGRHDTDVRVQWGAEDQVHFVI